MKYNKKINKNLIQRIRKNRLQENIGKYFYIVGDAEKTTNYFDNDTYTYIPEVETLDNGWTSKKYNTFEEVIADIVKEGYDSVDEKVNFPKDYDYLEEVREKDCIPQNYNSYQELISYWCTREEEFGPEYQEVVEEVSRLIQICKEII